MTEADDIHLVLKVLDVGSTRPRQIMRRSTHTQHIWWQELCCRMGHVCGTASQHTCTMRTSLTTVS